MQTENNGVVAAQETNVAAEVAKSGAVEIHTPYHEALADLNQAEQPVGEAVAEAVAETQPADGRSPGLTFHSDAGPAETAAINELVDSLPSDAQEQVAEAGVLETEEAVLAPLVGESLDTPVTGEHVNTEQAPAGGFREGEEVLVLASAGTDISKSQAGEAFAEMLADRDLAVEALAAESVVEVPAEEPSVEAAKPAVPAKKKKTFVVENSPLSVAKSIVGVEALKEFGFGEGFINSEEKRVIVFDIRTGLPVLDENFEGSWKEIEISGKLESLTVLESEHKLVVISAIATETNTFYQFVKEHVFFNFVQREVSNTPQEVVNALLASNLSAGRKFYDASAEVMEGFWYELFKAVYQEQTIVNLTLKSQGGTKVPARLYVDPVRQDRCMLSVGGVCFDFTLGEFPDRAIAEGVKAYLTEKKKAEEAARERENKRGGRMVIKQKQERVRPSAISAMKSETAPVLGYGQLPPAKPVPVAKTPEQRAEDRRLRELEKNAGVETADAAVAE